MCKVISVFTLWPWEKNMRGSTIHNVTSTDDVIRVSVEKVFAGDAQVPLPMSEIQYVK